MTLSYGRSRSGTRVIKKTNKYPLIAFQDCSGKARKMLISKIECYHCRNAVSKLRLDRSVPVSNT